MGSALQPIATRPGDFGLVVVELDSVELVEVARIVTKGRGAAVTLVCDAGTVAGLYVSRAGQLDGEHFAMTEVKTTILAGRAMDAVAGDGLPSSISISLPAGFAEWCIWAKGEATIGVSGNIGVRDYGGSIESAGNK